MPFHSNLQSPHSQHCKTSAALFGECTHALENILKIRTESVVDGTMNIWIIKPGSSSRGRGKAGTTSLIKYSKISIIIL